MEVSTTVDGEAIDPRLEPLLQAVRHAIERDPTDLSDVRRCLEDLLVFLSSPQGRTNANCAAADSFFLFDDYWSRGWDHLPEAYGDVLGHIGGGLHDTVSAPKIAMNFDATPEQILARLRRIRAE